MSDFNIEVPSFEQFLTEDTKALSDANHAKHTGDQKADDVDGDMPNGGKGSEADDVVEKSANAAPGDASADADLPKPPVA